MNNPAHSFLYTYGMSFLTIFGITFLLVAIVLAVQYISAPDYFKQELKEFFKPNSHTIAEEDLMADWL